MNKENILEVIKALTGKINPIADAAIDSERLENLKLFIDVFDEMFLMMNDIRNEWNEAKYSSVIPFVDAINEELEICHLTDKTL
jgi:hypothetical protein